MPPPNSTQSLENVVAPSAVSARGESYDKNWTPEEDAALRAVWAIKPSTRFVARALGLTAGQVAGRALRINLHYHQNDVPKNLPMSHRAMLEMRTTFPARVLDPTADKTILKPGASNRKLGDVVEKGEWRGMPIYSLTLEERATCPRTCHLLSSCYGNSMSFSVRFKHGVELEMALERELATLAHQHRDGFVVRLHVLGDFYSVGYVNFWKKMLRKHARLHVWGYTARPMEGAIGKAILSAPVDRFFIRFSGETRGPFRTMTVTKAQAENLPRDVIICPVETGKTQSCGSCGLCWALSASGKTIAFLLHGNK